MGYPTKIATCCYCGSRTTLVLNRQRHELTCGSCGAPLHNMKMLPAAKQEKPKPKRTYVHHAKAKPKPRKVKKRKGFMSKLFDEASDVIEDIFD